MIIEEKKTLLKVIPCGGVGEIGSNMTVFETQSTYFIIDYGILFPYENFFDINYLIVNTQKINPQKKIILFFSHGHEDHIGAVAHFISNFPTTDIYAPAFAATLIRKKLEKRNISAKLKIYNESDSISFDNFTVHPIHVTHSIPDTYGVVINDNAQKVSILYISDFKFDLNPIFERPINIQKIGELFNHSSKRICFLDSTNILVNDKTLSERDLLNDIDFLLSKKKRTFITLFSSNIFRLKIIIESAKKHQKTIVTVGRSFSHYLEAAHENHLLDLTDVPIKDISEIINVEDPNLIILLTGCQGDFLGGLRRVISGEHRDFKLKSSDQVIFSSKAIPGNSKKISMIYNSITEQGAEVITANDFQIHASGHPGQTDLRLLLNEINPTDYVPIHGESYFLKKHYNFIKHNYKFRPHLMHNFDELILDENYNISFQKNDSPQPELIHGKDLIIEREKISERRKMACNGTIFISLNLKQKKITLDSLGLPEFIGDYKDTFIDMLGDTAFNTHRNKQADYIAEKVRIKCRQIYNNILGYKPITIVHTL